MFIIPFIIAIFVLGMSAMIIRNPVAGLYLGVAFSGVLITPDLPLVGTRLAVSDLPIILALVSLVLHVWIVKSTPIPISRSVRSIQNLFVLFLFVVAMSFLFNGAIRDVDLFSSFVEVLNYFYGFLIACAVVVALDDWGKWNKFVIFWMVGVAVVSLISVGAILGVAPEWAYHGGGRIKSTARSVNQLHSYLAPAIPLLVGLLVTAKEKSLRGLWPVAIIIFTVIALGVTGSRTAFILSIFVLVAAMWSCIRYLPRSPLAATYGIVLVMPVIGVAAYYLINMATMGAGPLPEEMSALMRPIERTLTADGVDEYLGPRGEQASIIWKNAEKTVVLGVGPGNFMEVFNHKHSVHSTYLGVLIEVGVLGLFLLLAALGLILINAYRATKRIADKGTSLMMSMVIIAFVALCLYGVATFGLRQRIFWLLIGLVMAGINIHQVGKRNGHGST